MKIHMVSVLLSLATSKGQLLFPLFTSTFFKKHKLDLA